jgi:Ca2+-binding RTX toxin-like protein
VITKESLSDGSYKTSDANSASVFDSSGSGTFTLSDGTTDFGTITEFDNATYTLRGQGGDDTLTVDPESAKSHFLFGGSGNDFLSGGQVYDWLDGGSGNDTLIASGGNDRMLGGSGDDKFVLATRDDDTTGGDGRVLMLLGGGDDQVIAAPLDNTGIDIDAIIGDFARGADRVSVEALTDNGGSVSLSSIIDGDSVLDSAADQINLDGFGADYVDADGDSNSVGAEGSIKLLGINVDRLTTSDFISNSVAEWRDEFDTALGLTNV